MIGAFALGWLSDRVGRRPVLLICLLWYVQPHPLQPLTTSLTHTTAPTHTTTHNLSLTHINYSSAISLTATVFVNSLWSLMLIRGVAGLFAGSIATACSYISDVTKPAGRGQFLGYIGIPIGLVRVRVRVGFRFRFRFRAGTC